MFLSRKIAYPVLSSLGLLAALAGATGCDSNAVNLGQMINARPIPSDAGPLVVNPARMTALGPHRSYPNTRMQALQPRLLEASQTQYLR